MPHELSTSNASPERGIRMCLTWCRHGRPRRLTCQVPVAGHQRRDRSRAFPGPVLRGVVRNRPSGAPGRQKLEDVCGPPGRMSPLNEGHDHDDSAECPCHWRASSSGKQGSKWGKTGSGEPRIFPARWPFTRDYQISTVCFASRGSWVRFPSSPPGLTRRDCLIGNPVKHRCRCQDVASWIEGPRRRQSSAAQQKDGEGPQQVLEAHVRSDARRVDRRGDLPLRHRRGDPHHQRQATNRSTPDRREGIRAGR